MGFWGLFINLKKNWRGREVVCVWVVFVFFSFTGFFFF